MWKHCTQRLIIIINSDFGVASSTLVKAVQEAIDPDPQGTGSGIAPIGHTVTVVSAVGKTVNIKSRITLNDGYQWSQVKPKAEETLEAYFLEMRKNWEKGNLVVRISQIENRLLKIHEERVIATGSDRRGKKTSGYSFSGKLVCGICGAPYWRKQRVSKDEYWVCSTKQTKGRRTRKRDSTMGKAGEINPLGCDNENISYNSLMEIMGVVSERLQANTDTIKHDMINWLTKLRKQLLEANGGHTEADLQRELSRKSKLLDAYLDGILNKQEYQKKAEELM